MCWEYGWTILVSALYDGSCLTLKYQACPIKIIMDKHSSLFSRSIRNREKKFYSMGDSRDKITKISKEKKQMFCQKLNFSTRNNLWVNICFFCVQIILLNFSNFVPTIVLVTKLFSLFLILLPIKLEGLHLG
jgi:hypothetical protein